MLFVFGFWLADYQTGKITLNKQDMRIDVTLDESACKIAWRGETFLFEWPNGLCEAVEKGQKFLPPDIQGILLWLDTLNK
jgi:hypothetical protein